MGEIWYRGWEHNAFEHFCVCENWCGAGYSYCTFQKIALFFVIISPPPETIIVGILWVRTKNSELLVK
jgi:hypothetical protein